MHSCHNIWTDSNPICSLFHIERPLVATLSFLCVIFGQIAILSDQFQDRKWQLPLIRVMHMPAKFLCLLTSTHHIYFNFNFVP
jgi:hypothetical protein